MLLSQEFFVAELDIGKRSGLIRAKQLACALSLALLTSSTTSAHAEFPQNGLLPLRSSAGTRAPTAPVPVSSCNDDGPGSLRDVIANDAQSGDVVDMSGLQCSTITLSSGEIVVPQSDLTLLGADPDALSISGNHASRVVRHDGSGTLSIQGLTIRDGYYHSASDAFGGCIESPTGNVYLRNSAVKQCKVVSVGSVSWGGGIFAQKVILVTSEVSGNEAATQSGNTAGGGVFAYSELTVKYSSISSNAAMGYSGRGGAVRVGGTTTVFNSTIDNNFAGLGGGIVKGGNGAVTISESTISSNSAYRIAALDISGNSLIQNSTIAFNHASSNAMKGAVYIFQASDLTLQSSIIANNTFDVGNQPYDLQMGVGTLDGKDNLVMSSNVSPPGVITVTTDPKLGEFQFNGGRGGRTHTLLPNSLAIGRGNNIGGNVYDQRGFGYPRTSGPTASVDIGALQSDFIFVAGFDGQ